MTLSVIMDSAMGHVPQNVFPSNKYFGFDYENEAPVYCSKG